MSNKKKPKTVDPKNQPHRVGALAPWGGTFIFKQPGYCEKHEIVFEGTCPVCDNAE